MRALNIPCYMLLETRDQSLLFCFRKQCVCVCNVAHSLQISDVPFMSALALRRCFLVKYVTGNDVFCFFINKDPFVDKILQGVISVCVELGDLL